MPVTPILLPVSEPPSRGRRLRAVVYDLTGLALAVVLAFIAAVAWLLARTEAGRFDVADVDGALAAAVLLAALPAWVAWAVLGLVRQRGTPGQRAAGIEVVPESEEPRGAGWWLRAGLAAVVHPLAVPAWLWLAAVVALAGYEVAALVPLALAAVAALFGVLSFVMLLARPSMPPLHDQLAGVRPVLRSEAPRS